jgi:hypothetical protein
MRPTSARIASCPARAPDGGPAPPSPYPQAAKRVTKRTLSGNYWAASRDSPRSLKANLEVVRLRTRTAANRRRRKLTLTASSGHSRPKKLTSGMTGLKVEQP